MLWDHQTVEYYLATLRLVPDESIIAAAGREFFMANAESCVCGWVVRETMARLLERDAQDVDVRSSDSVALMLYGGDECAWYDLYIGVTDLMKLPLIEEAFVLRLDEAVTRSTTTH